MACPPGEEEDPFTYACVHHTAPGQVGGAMGAPSEQELTACSGADRSQCLEGQLYGPQAPLQQPHSSVSSSP